MNEVDYNMHTCSLFAYTVEKACVKRFNIRKALLQCLWRRLVLRTAHVHRQRITQRIRAHPGVKKPALNVHI